MQLLMFRMSVPLIRRPACLRRRRPQYEMAASFDLGQAPTTKEAQAIADELYADFVSQDVDKVRNTPAHSSQPQPGTRTCLSNPGNVATAQLGSLETFVMTREVGSVP